jgi:hypothetical protein
MAEDLRSGAGGVIGASRMAAANALFVSGRWLRRVLYLRRSPAPSWRPCWRCHAGARRGADRTARLPADVCAGAAADAFSSPPAARCCSTAGPADGQAGDVLYFIVWVAQMALLPAVAEYAWPAFLATSRASCSIIGGLAPRRRRRA